MTGDEFRKQYRSGTRKFDGQDIENLSISNLAVEGCRFTGATFRGVAATHAVFHRCDFDNVEFDGGSFWSSRFQSCSFRASQLTDVRITDVDIGDADFSGARFSYATLTQTVIEESNFDGAELLNIVMEQVATRAVTFRRTKLDRVVFSDTDLFDFCSSSLAAETHTATVDWRSVCRSILAPRLSDFMRDTGMPELFVTYMLDCAKALDPSMLFNLMLSVFISYGGPDVGFARKLRDELVANGVRTFLFQTDAIPGEKLHHTMRQGVASHDRVLLICSRSSLQRAGVLNEIEQTLSREARDGGVAYLIPITIDDYVYEWNPARQELAQEVRDRVVGDFRGATTDERSFHESVGRLLTALRRSRTQ